MIDLIDYGYTSEMSLEKDLDIVARIIAVHKQRYEIVCKYGISYAQLKRSAYYGNSCKEFKDFPTTGDFVMLRYNEHGDSLIVKTLERKTKFARNDFSGHKAGYVKTVLEQIVAANFDYVFIMQSLNNDLNLKRLERYLTLAWQSKAVPVIILTKSDLIVDFTKQVEMVEKIAVGVNVHPVSVVTSQGMDMLSQYLKPTKTIVFLGSSGVGKSSLVNALMGDDIMAVQTIREDDSRGRHTTTHRQLIMLKNGVMIIDTPGMRELGMWDVSTGIGEAFSDVEDYLGKCKFSDCKHISEPGCAIKSAINSGELPLDRWESYKNIISETKFVNAKSRGISNEINKKGVKK